MAMQHHLPLSALRNTIHTYPTLSTGIQQLAFEAYLHGAELRRHQRVVQALLALRRLLKRETSPSSNGKEPT